ncbi:hypothetical protein B296_00004427 [Ensete ventricosum]|uniref:AMP-dependent synthetase/ligase domain-containing protein n=1 Tax=Ensete ventricosum TaxID=4639 RepID=A0A427AWL2_ENSVE|nr:hypothetical protein B296_00004427 [Ensete ventricosum]
MCGSSALPFPVMKQWEEITGHRLLERYGMTEVSVILFTPYLFSTLFSLFYSLVAAQTLWVKILAEDGSEVVTRGVGELCVRSPSLFKEYWKLPKVTEGSITDDGFFKTGDTVTTDEDGYYVILGRKRLLTRQCQNVAFWAYWMRIMGKLCMIFVYIYSDPDKVVSVGFSSSKCHGKG